MMKISCGGPSDEVATYGAIMDFYHDKLIFL
jgi:hypothetical protein